MKTLMICNSCGRVFEEIDSYNLRNGNTACPYCINSDIEEYDVCSDGCNRNCIHD